MKTTNNIFCLLLLITISSFKIFGADNKEKTWSPFRNNSTQRYAEEYSDVNESLVNKDKDNDTLTSKEKITKVLRNSNEYIKLAKAASNKVRELNNYKDKLSKEYELPFAITKKVGGKDYEIIIDSLVITPKYVTISGPSNIIDKITYWKTDSLKATNVSDSIKTRIKLAPVKEGNIGIYPNSVQVQIPVNEFTEKTIDVPVILVNNSN